MLLRAFRAMHQHPQNTYSICTKRPERLLEVSQRLVEFEGQLQLSAEVGRPYLPVAKNIRLGVSAENQELFDQRLAVLSEVNTPNRWAAVEPMLGAVRVTVRQQKKARLKWMLIGAETGRGARPIPLTECIELINDAKRLGIPVWVTTLGKKMFWRGEWLRFSGAWDEMTEWPADFQYQEDFAA